MSLGDSVTHPHRKLFIEKMLALAPVEGYVLEFGVGQGHSVSLLSRLTERTVVGFDSFEGLPESWSFSPHVIFAKGSFKYDIPPRPSNVEYVVGWFEETLPKWKKQNTSSIAFLHIDSDLYSSCKTVLQELNNRIVEGTVILFDEFHNYPNWKEGEWKAKEEWAAAYDRELELLAEHGTQAAFLVVR